MIIWNSRSFHTSESPERCVMLECNVSNGYCAEKDKNKDLSTWEIWLGKEPCKLRTTNCLYESRQEGI